MVEEIRFRAPASPWTTQRGGEGCVARVENHGGVGACPCGRDGLPTVPERVRARTRGQLNENWRFPSLRGNEANPYARVGGEADRRRGVGYV